MEARASRHWYVRPLAALALLTAEYLATSVVFDARQLAVGRESA